MTGILSVNTVYNLVSSANNLIVTPAGAKVQMSLTYSINNIERDSPGDSQTSCKVWLTFVKPRWCSNEANTRNPLKLAQTNEPISAVSGPNDTIL